MIFCARNLERFSGVTVLEERVVRDRQGLFVYGLSRLWVWMEAKASRTELNIVGIADADGLKMASLVSKFVWVFAMESLRSAAGSMPTK